MRTSFKKRLEAIRISSLIFKKILFLLSACMLIPFSAETITAESEKGIEADYFVEIKILPEFSMTITAEFRNVPASGLLLDNGLEYNSFNLDVIKNLSIKGNDKKAVSFTKIDQRTIEIKNPPAAIIATYDMDLSKTNSRGTKVDVIGAVVSGFEAFLTPADTGLSKVSVEFDVPKPWKIVSSYPQNGNRFEITNKNYSDLVLETKISGWYIGETAIDKTVEYDDGFKVRLVAFKNMSLRHWNAYTGGTPLSEAEKIAEMYHKTYLKLSQRIGEFPYDQILVVGPDFWQAGISWSTQGLSGERMTHSISHHMLHAYYGHAYPVYLNWNGYFFDVFREGFTTYVEGQLTYETKENPVWLGMSYERKLHYDRGYKFENLDQNSAGYVKGPVTVYMMDDKLKTDSDNTKDIYGLMAFMWSRHHDSMPVFINDQEVLEDLREYSGVDWTGFYDEYIVNKGKLDTTAMEKLKDDFPGFLKYVADYWYNGHESAYFINVELVSAIGHFGYGTQTYSPYIDLSPLGKFILAARKYKDLSKRDLTEKDIIKVLNSITQKDHSDFFKYYRGLGFTVDTHDISDFLRSVSIRSENQDNLIRLNPEKVTLGKPTNITAKILEPEIITAQSYIIQINVYDSPKGISKLENLITGKGVIFIEKRNFQGGFLGDGTQLFYEVPRKMVKGKAYLTFTLNMPKDAGVLEFYLNASIKQDTYNSYLGGFIGTEKVMYQDGFSFRFITQ